MKKKILLFIMTLFVCITSLPYNIFAQTNEEILNAKKISIKKENVGEYDIKISVPGTEEEKVHSYNFLFVIDATTSMRNNKWNATRSALLEMVNILLPADTKNNVNKVALMSFGIDYHLNIPLTNDKNLFNKIPVDYYDASEYLLSPGRSATNTEVALTGAYDYLNNLPSNLKKDKEHTIVIFLTDAEANQSLEKYNYYEKIYTKKSNGDWPSYGRFKLVPEIRKMFKSALIALEEDTKITRDSFYDIAIKEIKDLYKEKYPEKEVSFSNMNKELADNEDYNNILDKAIKAFNEQKGIDTTKSYSISEMERMAHYSEPSVGDNDLNEYLKEIIYYEMVVGVPTSDKLEVERTIIAGNKIAEISSVNTICFGSCSKWESKMIMDPDYYYNETGKKHYSSMYATASEDDVENKLKTLVSEFVAIKYKNPTIVDYTSKWVIPMDVNGDGIFNENDIKITNNGEEVDTKSLTVKKLTKEEIKVLNDKELNGNTNNDIYEIRWELKEYLRSWDKFEMTYKVKVDTQEKNFLSDKNYKANGKTTLIYDHVSKSNLKAEEEILEEDVTYDIEVPTVKQKENVIIIKKVDENNQPLKGADFDIVSEDGLTQIKKEYSIDGKNWTSENINNNATYFKFSGLYDYEYEIEEVTVPDNFEKINNKNFNFNNKEGKTKEISIVNAKIKGIVIVHFIDEDGNVIHKEIKTEELVGNDYETFPKEFDNYSLIKVEGEEEGKYIEGEIHVTYIYSNNKEEKPPHTDCETKKIHVISIFFDPNEKDRKKKRR